MENIKEEIDRLNRERESQFLQELENLSIEYGVSLKATPYLNEEGRIVARIILTER